MKDKLIALIKSVGKSFETYTLEDGATKYALAKAKANELVDEFTPYDGEEVTTSNGTYRLVVKPIGTIYRTSKGKKKRTKTNSVQLLPIADRVGIDFL
jgi:hypothetical protein